MLLHLVERKHTNDCQELIKAAHWQAGADRLVTQQLAPDIRERRFTFRRSAVQPATLLAAALLDLNL